MITKRPETQPRRGHGPGRTRTRTRLITVAIASALAFTAAVVPLSQTAAAQSTTDDLNALNRTKRDLDAKISDQDQKIAAGEQAVADSTSQVRKANVKFELVADDYARVVDSRREPARTRVAIAIDAYVRGDPLVTNIFEELLNLDSVSDDVIQRELYRAVVADADARLQVIDDRLRELAEQVTAQQQASQGLRDQLAAAEQQRDEAIATKQQLTAERAEVQRKIEEIESRATRAILTGTSSFEDQSRPALVVKIDNVDAARPQSGINQADVVFEEEVEAGLSRLAAVFHSTSSNPVGPIRSVRTSDVLIFANLNQPLFSSSGGNAGTRAELKRSSLVDVGPTEYPDIYYREKRPPPHNYYSRTTDIWGAASGTGGSPPNLFSFRPAGSPLPASAIQSAGVDINFGSTKVSYEWTGSGWARTQNGRAHVDASGARVTPKNLIVQFTQYGRSPADNNSPEANPTGSGEAWVFTDGHLIRGTWSRPAPGSVTTYTDEAGNTISLTPGNTWIALPRPGRASLR